MQRGTVLEYDVKYIVDVDWLVDCAFNAQLRSFGDWDISHSYWVRVRVDYDGR